MNRSPVPALALAALLSCRGETAPPGPSTQPAPSSSCAGECAAQQRLSRLDDRKPVPLLPHMAQHQKQNMRDHLVAVQAIVAGLSSDDFAAVEEAARRLGTSETMGRMCSHMGLGAPGFTEQALAFHATADAVGEAARRHDRDGATRALGATLTACTGCHAAWRQEIVDEARWATIEASPPHGP